MPGSKLPSELIDAKIEGLGDWRGEMLARLRALIREAACSPCWRPKSRCEPCAR